MRFTSIIVTGALAMFASAQDTTGTTSASPTAATTDAAQASSLACLDACDDGDVTCQAKCIAVSTYGCGSGPGVGKAPVAYVGNECLLVCILWKHSPSSKRDGCLS